MATKTHPHETSLERSTDGSSYSALTDLTAVTPPGVNVPESDNTTLANTDAVRTSQASWVKPGPCGFTGYFTKAQYTTLLADAYARTNLYWRLKTDLIDSEATNSNWTFRGFVGEITHSEASKDSDDLLTVSFVITVTAKPTFTAGS